MQASLKGRVETVKVLLHRSNWLESGAPSGFLQLYNFSLGLLFLVVSLDMTVMDMALGRIVIILDMLEGVDFFLETEVGKACCGIIDERSRGKGSLLARDLLKVGRIEDLDIEKSCVAKIPRVCGVEILDNRLFAQYASVEAHGEALCSFFGRSTLCATCAAQGENQVNETVLDEIRHYLELE